MPIISNDSFPRSAWERPNRNRRHPNGRFAWLIAVTCMLCFLGEPALADDAARLFQKAKKQTVGQKWDDAIQLYKQFIHEFAGHKDEDDAFFWLAYCMEKKKPDDIQAFLAYDELIHAFPKSVWADDAVVHQVGMAAQFVQSGNEEFRSYLTDKLRSDNRQVRLQAALALGQIGDRESLPVLKKLAEDPNYYALVSPLIQKIESVSSRETQSASAKSRSGGMVEVNTEQAQLKKEKNWEWSGLLPTIYTARHRQYQSMLRTDDAWTMDELIEFGMWTILPTGEFESYQKLSGYDRSEWLRKYWKKLDPTPTTIPNEAYDEFMRRVNFAYANYSEKWDYRNLEYKRDMYQRSGWPNAPWDARGELYIKYGPPQFQSLEGWHTEKWDYFKYNVDFIVRLYETNIYNDAIEPGPLSEYNFKDQIDYVNANFISKPEFRYIHEFNATPLNLKENRFYSEGGVLKFDYTIPIKELGYEKKGELYQFHYDLTVVVFDEDMREVVRYEKEKTFERADKNAYKKDKNYQDQVQLRLVPGPYLVSIQIEDQYSDKLGIFLKDLDTSGESRR